MWLPQTLPWRTLMMKHCGVAVKQEVSWCSASCLLSLLVVGLGEHSLLGLPTKCENSQVRGWKKGCY